MNYLKLYKEYIKRSLYSKLVYKVNSLIGIFGFLIGQVFSILGIYFIVKANGKLMDWDVYQILFLYGATNISIGIDHLFSDRLWTVSYWEVKDGKLDTLFLRPLPLLFQVLASEFQTEALGEMIVGIGLMIFSSFFINLHVTFGNILFLIVGLICGALIITSLKIIVASFAFVFKRSGPLLQIVYNFLNYSKYPIKIFPYFIRIIFCFVIPLGIAIYFPVGMLLNIETLYNPYYLCLIALGFTIILITLSILIWSKFVKQYESTGS